MATRRATEIRRQQILDAARELIVKHGSEQLTIGRIARSASISDRHSNLVDRYVPCWRVLRASLQEPQPAAIQAGA